MLLSFQEQHQNQHQNGINFLSTNLPKSFIWEQGTLAG